MGRFFKSYILVGLLLMYCATAMADGADRIVQMPKCKGTVYQLLEKITEKTGMMFIYDSKIINNQKRTEIKKGTYSIRLAVCEIVGNTNLDIKSIGNHILITLPVTHTAAPVRLRKRNAMCISSSREHCLTSRHASRLKQVRLAYRGRQ